MNVDMTITADPAIMAKFALTLSTMDALFGRYRQTGEPTGYCPCEACGGLVWYSRSPFNGVLTVKCGTKDCIDVVLK